MPTGVFPSCASYCKISPVHANGFYCSSVVWEILDYDNSACVCTPALNIHVGDPFVVSHSLPHDLMLSFCITCILQVYHPVTTTSKSEIEV